MRNKQKYAPPQDPTLLMVPECLAPGSCKWTWV